MSPRLRRGSALTRVVFGAALSITLLTGWWTVSHTSAANPLVEALPGQANRSSVKSAVHLYFGDAQGRYLVAEQRIVDKPVGGAAFAAQLIGALIGGPTQGATRTLPVEARLDAIYVTAAGVAYVDFAANSFFSHPGGIGAELLSIYSIVNTLVLNVDGIRSVKFLIGGREAATLAGHADLQSPFEVDMLWVR